MFLAFRNIAGFSLATLLLVCSLAGLTSCNNTNSYEHKDFSLRIYSDAEPVKTEASESYRASTTVFGQSGYSTYENRAVFSLLAKVDSDNQDQIKKITYTSNQNNVSIALQNDSDNTSLILKNRLDNEANLAAENPKKMTKLWVAIDSVTANSSDDFHQIIEKYQESANSSGWMLELLEEDFLTVQVEFKDGEKVKKSYALKPVPLHWNTEEKFTFLISEKSL